MIYINRNNVNKPQVLTDKADVEHNKAHKHYVDDKKTEAYDHKLFKELEVKKALEKLFNGKCAYCESKVNKTSPIDKEHFRPKTKVKNKGTGESKRGYYWLAAEWENLLSACAHCNRTGTHETSSNEECVSGKLDYFPLDDEGKRAKYNQDLVEEEKVRLLINPCIDKPEELISYNEDGEIHPLPNIADLDTKKVKKSVEIYGLQRSELHKDRRQTWLDITAQIERIKTAFKNYVKFADDDFMVTLKKELKHLKDMRSIEREHLGVVRFVIRKELTEIRKILVAIQEE